MGPPSLNDALRIHVMGTQQSMGPDVGGNPVPAWEEGCLWLRVALRDARAGKRGYYRQRQKLLALRRMLKTFALHYLNNRDAMADMYSFTKS